MVAGIIGDPFYRDNEYRDKWVYMTDFSWSRHFALEALPEGKTLLLECDGLDTLCRIYLNGAFVAETRNMFRRYAFDVTGLLRAGDNEIRIDIASPGKYFEEHAGKDNGHTAGDSLPGSEQLRKCPLSRESPLSRGGIVVCIGHMLHQALFFGIYGIRLYNNPPAVSIVFL